MTANGKPAQKPRYWLITSPRTASNMLVKILNLDAQGVRPAQDGGYFFMSSVPKRFTMQTNPMKEWSEQDMKEVQEGQQASFDSLQDYIEGAEKEDQVIFVKEHALFTNDVWYEAQYSHGKGSTVGKPTPLAVRGLENPTRSALNLTSMPDEFLKTWHPTFLIRHPAMMLPSLYRTTQNNLEVRGFKRPNKAPMIAETTMKWIRTLYEFYADYFGADSQWPLVLDADDVMKQPELVAKYAPMAGLQEDKLRFSWDKVPEDKLKELNPIAQRMLSSIAASTGVDHTKLAGAVDIDAEAVKWREEFGEEGGRNLESWVRAAMPDYEYLRSKRLTL